MYNAFKELYERNGTVTIQKKQNSSTEISQNEWNVLHTNC